MKLILLSLLSTVALSAPYSPEPGPFPVNVVDLELKDIKRDRPIPVRVYSPGGKEPAPVIVLSHGAGGSRETYEFLGTHWASHGYLSIHPTHVGSDRAKLTKGRPIRNAIALKKMVNDPSELANRPKDVSFLIDSLSEIGKKVEAKADLSRVGIAGHSYGSYTVMALAGAEITFPGLKDSKLRDARPLAFLAMSAQGAGRMGFSDKSWSKIERPLFTITGTKDTGFDGESVEWRMEPFQGVPAGGKYNAVLVGANHMTFAGMDFRGTADGVLVDYLKSMTLAFWDAHLKKQAGGKAYLLSLPKLTLGKVRIESK